MLHCPMDTSLQGYGHVAPGKGLFRELADWYVGAPCNEGNKENRRTSNRGRDEHRTEKQMNKERMNKEN